MTAMRCRSRSLLLGRVAGAQAQDYPTGRSRWSCRSRPAGRPTRSCAILGERMRVSLGQPLVVENTSPAPAARVGTGRVARAAPDGYTIICGHFGTHVTNGAVYPLPYDLVKDFAPISLLAAQSVSDRRHARTCRRTTSRS